MYVYQFIDGTWRLALYTSRRDDFAAILANAAALRAYDAVYLSQRAAEKAALWIAEELGAAF